MIALPFSDRDAAGRLLAAEIEKRKPPSPVVYALPRGGVPVAAPIAEALGAPLDLLFVRKIGVPGYEELAAGSIIDGERPDIVINEEIVHGLRLSEADIEAAARRGLREIDRRRALYQPGRTPQMAKDRTAILVDDGIATGASMRAAIEAVRRRAPRSVMVAVPVASRETAQDFATLVDDFVCLATPPNFRAVGLYYRDFHQVTDEEVITLLRLAEKSESVGDERRPTGANPA
ncbi:MAG: phosphoribosyltransferase [Amphiplicatus sp.]